jgi:hypothetical protein
MFRGEKKARSHNPQFLSRNDPLAASARCRAAAQPSGWATLNLMSGSSSSDLTRRHVSSNKAPPPCHRRRRCEAATLFSRPQR